MQTVVLGSLKKRTGRIAEGHRTLPALLAKNTTRFFQIAGVSWVLCDPRIECSIYQFTGNQTGITWSACFIKMNS